MPCGCMPCPSSCRASGCAEPRCELCRNNPRRRCTSDLSAKLKAGEPIKAKCGAAVSIELVDSTTGWVVEQGIPGLRLEVSGVLMQLT